MLRAVEIDVRSDQRWDLFVRHHPDALIYHHSNWLAVLEEEYGQKFRCLACEDADGCVRAILPLIQTQGMPFKIGRSPSGRRWSSLPRTPLAGPLALDDEAMSVVLRQAIALARAEPDVQLEIKTRYHNLNDIVPELSRVPWRFTYIEQLPVQTEGAQWEEFCDHLRLPRECGPCQGCRRLRFGNARRQHRVNWAVKKAIRLGLQVRPAETEADISAWYRLYLDSMRYDSFPPRSYRFFFNLWSRLQPLGQMKLLLAEQKNVESSRIVAGSILLCFGQTVFYGFTGCSHRDFRLHPHDIIQMEAIRDSCKNGFRWYDFGEVTNADESLAQFKGKWGAEPKPLYRYYYPAPADMLNSKPSRLISLGRRSWRSLPLSVTALLGDRVHRYL